MIDDRQASQDPARKHQKRGGVSIMHKFQHCILLGFLGEAIRALGIAKL
jgi:hypothetical protein